jgi:hypothetical protein
MYKLLPQRPDGLADYPLDPSSNRSAQARTEDGSDVDPVGYFVACILDIIPDIECDHVKKLVTDTVEAYGSGTVERVLLILFDDPKYPKVRKESKEKESLDVASTRESLYGGFHYGDHNKPFTGGPSYTILTRVRHFHFN